MTENEQFIYESLYNQVQMGYMSIEVIKENILEEIEDNDFEDEISQEWVFEQIENEWNTLLADSKNWETPSNTDRLIAAFDELCESNIIALHNAGFTTSDGEYEVVEVERALRENDIVSDGYCFYHEQDLADAVAKENPRLCIAFQKIDNEEEAVTIEVGKKVATVLRKHGLNVEWDESANQKICLPNFRWQRIYNEQNMSLLNYEEVVEQMIK